MLAPAAIGLAQRLAPLADPRALLTVSMPGVVAAAIGVWGSHALGLGGRVRRRRPDRGRTGAPAHRERRCQGIAYTNVQWSWRWFAVLIAVTAAGKRRPGARGTGLEANHVGP